MHPHRAKSHFVKYAGLVTSDYAINTISSVITSYFIGEDVYLSQHSIDGYEAMGFDVTQLTQDMEQSSFTIKTNMPIPLC